MSRSEGSAERGPHTRAADPTSRAALVVAAVAARAELAPEDVRPEHDLREDLGLDSIALVELAVELARRLGLPEGALEAPDLRRVADLQAQVERALASPR